MDCTRVSASTAVSGCVAAFDVRVGVSGCGVGGVGVGVYGCGAGVVVGVGVGVVGGCAGARVDVHSIIQWTPQVESSTDVGNARIGIVELTQLTSGMSSRNPACPISAMVLRPAEGS